jgi:dihydrofolate reductase
MSSGGGSGLPWHDKAHDKDHPGHLGLPRRFRHRTDPGPDNGLGTGGEALHTWAFSNDPDDRRVLRGATARSGAVILGRQLFDVVDGPNGWNDDSGYGAGEVGKPAFVVVTSSPPESVRLIDLDWTFVTTGLPDAITATRERAEAASSDSGKDLDVVLMGGGATIGSALDAGLVDALTLHLAPVVLGAGTPLFTGGSRARWCSGA